MVITFLEISLSEPARGFESRPFRHFGALPHQQSMACQNMTGYFYKVAEGIADESLEAENLAT